LSRVRLTPLLLGALAAALLAWVSGPTSFDAVDGAEFALAGNRLEIPHAPGYPLFMMILRAGSLILGPLYGHMRLVTCILAGACFPAAFLAMSGRGVSGPGALAGAAALFLPAPVLSHLNVLEVHGLAMLLILLAVAGRNRRAGPFLASMAVFGGHPAGILMLPMAVSRKWLSRWTVLAALPVSLLLYVPLRAGGAGIAHFTRPASLAHAVAYFSMHAGRLGAPSPDGLMAAAGALGIVCGAAMAVLVAVGGRPSPGTVVSFFSGILFLTVYRVPDPESFAWLALLPAALQAARGADRLIRLGGSGKLALCCLLLPAGITGVGASWRGSDDAAVRYTMDVLASLPPGAVIHTEGHPTFYTAYMIFSEGVRRDLIPSDQNGNFFFLSLRRPLPESLGGRPVYSTRAWEDSALVLSGLLFGPPGMEPDWNSYDIFRWSGRSPDAMAHDLAAEAWTLRMVQSRGEARREAERMAMEQARTEPAFERIRRLSESRL
jgi:hypothetical protein